MADYLQNPARYELRNGVSYGDAPLCPYGNTRQWIGYDKELKIYVRFTTSVLKLKIKKYEQQ